MTQESSWSRKNGLSADLVVLEGGAGEISAVELTGAWRPVIKACLTDGEGLGKVEIFY